MAQDEVFQSELLKAVGEAVEGSPFVLVQRDILRARLHQVNLLMMKEKDAQKLDRLASAWSKLAEEERKLDGRPLPGSHRPSKARGSAAAPGAEPI